MKKFFQNLFQIKTSDPNESTKESTKETGLAGNNVEPNFSDDYGGPGAESISQITLEYTSRAKLQE